MKLWLLRPIGFEHNSRNGWGPWAPWYDKCFGYVIRAENEDDARGMAAGRAYDEKPEAWASAEFSTCVELTADGAPGIIIADVASA